MTNKHITSTWYIYIYICKYKYAGEDIYVYIYIFDWCSFDYFVRNNLVALLEALYACIYICVIQTYTVLSLCFSLSVSFSLSPSLSLSLALYTYIFVYVYIMWQLRILEGTLWHSGCGSFFSILAAIRFADPRAQHKSSQWLEMAQTYTQTYTDQLADIDPDF